MNSIYSVWDKNLSAIIFLYMQKYYFQSESNPSKNVQFTIATVNRQHNASVTRGEVGIVTAGAATDVQSSPTCSSQSQA